jgi:hypothetical protein
MVLILSTSITILILRIALSILNCKSSLTCSRLPLYHSFISCVTCIHRSVRAAIHVLNEVHVDAGLVVDFIKSLTYFIELLLCCKARLVGIEYHHPKLHHLVRLHVDDVPQAFQLPFALAISADVHIGTHRLEQCMVQQRLVPGCRISPAPLAWASECRRTYWDSQTRAVYGAAALGTWLPNIACSSRMGFSKFWKCNPTS